MQFADKVCKLQQTERNEGSFEVWGPRKCLHFWGAKFERRLTKVRQSKFFFKALENTIKISIPYKNTVYFRFTEKVHCFLFRYFKGVSRGPRKCLHFWGGYTICLRSETVLHTKVQFFCYIFADFKMLEARLQTAQSVSVCFSASICTSGNAK